MQDTGIFQTFAHISFKKCSDLHENYFDGCCCRDATSILACFPPICRVNCEIRKSYMAELHSKTALTINLD